MGRRIWVIVSGDGLPTFSYDCRVTRFRRLLPADGDKRLKHLVQLWTDPGGMRTLSLGSIRFKDPNRQRS